MILSQEDQPGVEIARELNIKLLSKYTEKTYKLHSLVTKRSSR